MFYRNIIWRFGTLWVEAACKALLSIMSMFQVEKRKLRIKTPHRRLQAVIARK